MEEKRHRVETVSLENLPPPKAVKSGSAKRKLPSVLSETDSYHRGHLKTAKRHIVAAKTTSAPKANPLFAASAAEAQNLLNTGKTTKLIPIQTALGTIQQFHELNPKNETTQSTMPKTLDTISGESFQGFDSLEQMLDDNMHYWKQRQRQNATGAVPQTDIPRISAKHIAKVLWQPHGAFKPCLASQTGNCRATMEAQLLHPFAPNVACMAYVSPEQHRKVQQSGKNDNEAELCEFCTRYIVNLLVLRAHHENMEIESEITPRLHIAGVPGEYAVDAMLQPITTSNGQKHAGVFGHFRLYSTADFVPVVGVLDAGGAIARTISLDEYKALSEEKQSKCVFGWRESGPYHSLNECALLEDNQIDPYERIFVTTQEQLTVDSLLRNYFERRTGHDSPNYSHLFLDLMECVAMSGFLNLPTPMDKYDNSKRFKYMCMHQETAVPEIETHKIYYVLLQKINACKAFIKKDMKNRPHICKKLALFVEAHDPLLTWLWNNSLDDASVREAVELDTNGTQVAMLDHRQPKFDLHYNLHDEYDAELRVETFARPDPLEVLQHMYRAQLTHALERDSCRLEHLKLLKDKLNSFDEFSTFSDFYTEATEAFENVVCHYLRGEVDFVWPENDKTVSRKASENAPDGKLDHTHRHMMQAFSQLARQIRCEKRTYKELLCSYGEHVFVPFAETLRWARTINLSDVVQKMDCFANIFPDSARLRSLSATEVNGVPWDKHTILFSTLFRIHVLENIHRLEDPQQRFMRYQLVLLRNSHLALFRKITEDPHALLTDEQLLHRDHHEAHPIANVFTLYEFYYPHPKREIHSGMLPNYGNGLTKVNFVTNCGMDDAPWNKMQFKKPTAERCCNGREFHEMLANICRTNKLFYRYTCLELELSFKGLYEHCTVVPSFARTVLLDELFDHTESEEVASFLNDFILVNQALVADATSESLCYLLEYCPALRDMLHNIHSNWFGWRAIANMDIARSVFETHGNFHRVKADVYDRIQLSSQKSIYRHVNADFTLYVCDLVKQFDIDRYGRGLSLPLKYQLQLHEQKLIENFVACRSPTALIELTDLRILYMNEHTLEVLWLLNRNFRERNLKESKLPGAPPALDITATLQSLHPKQYSLVSYFFEALLRHQSIRAVRITNASILRAQMSKLCERFGETELTRLPPNSVMLAYCPSCEFVKNAFVRKETHINIGYDLIAYDLMTNRVRCAKDKNSKSAKAKAKRRSAPKRIVQRSSVEFFERRVAKQQETECKTLSCKSTPITEICLVGDVVELNRCKVPKSRVVNNKEVSPPKPPFWIAPCCGRIINLDWEAWTPNAYQCKFCQNESKLANTDFANLLCFTCETQGSTLKIQHLYDDIQLQTFRNVAFCDRCNEICQRLPARARTLSAIVCATEDINWLDVISKYL